MKKLIFLLVVLTSCSSLPTCLKKEMDTFSKNNSCATAKVDQYTFQGKTVYVFDPGTCGADMTSKVVDQNCKVLGHLGGFAGNTKINGKSFSTAVLVKTVWKR